MLQRVCLALTICALVFVCGVQTTQAGWRDTGLARAHDASSLVISIKKHKHGDGDDNGDNHKHKKKKKRTATIRATKVRRRAIKVQRTREQYPTAT